jgi:hypothetical protein
MLNADLSGVDTSFPVLEPGIVNVVIAKCYQGTSKEKKTPGVFFEFTTTQDTRTTTGQSRKAGFTLRDTVWLTPPTDSYTPLTRLAQIKEAVFGEKSGSFGDPAGYVGKPVTLRIKVESSDEFGNQNRVAAYVKMQG